MENSLRNYRRWSGLVQSIVGFKELFIVKMEERSDEHLRNEKRD
jgi:hypothetical protein